MTLYAKRQASEVEESQSKITKQEYVYITGAIHVKYL